MNADDIVGDYDLVTSKALANITLQDLENIAYNAAMSAGEMEYVMFRTLADIRDTELWRQSSESTFGEYMSEWVGELHKRAASKGRTVPYSIRHVQKVLALHRRLVRWLAMDDKLVLTANPDVLDRMCRALGKWDYKTGALTEVNPNAQEWLDATWPDEPAYDQVRNTVEELVAIPRKGEALAYIRNITGSDGGTFIEFAVKLENGYPILSAKVSSYDEEFWCQPYTVWPGNVVAELAHRLGAVDPTWKEANE